MEYHSKYYKGENSPPEELNNVGQFFWGYEQSFYKHHTVLNNGKFPTKAEFNKWLDELLNFYLPDKMLTGYEAPNATRDKANDFREQYETGNRDY